MRDAPTRDQTRGLLRRCHRQPVRGSAVLMLGSLARQAAHWRQCET
jgi:hypothetical protein